MRSRFYYPVVAFLLVICLGCVPPATALPIVSNTPLAPTLTSVEPLQPTAPSATPVLVTPTLAEPSATFTPQATLPPTPDFDTLCPIDQSVCILDGHFLMERPIALTDNASVDGTYRYGSTQQGTREPHHGVEFPNIFGTPVLAAADGQVVFAGNDKNTLLAWVPAFYGNVVVIEHHFPGYVQPIFSLYAHLSFVAVTVGQELHQGDLVGKVGATGKAIGSHLHFEVRFGQNNYLSNRNPELWLAPLRGTGVLAGRIQSITGDSVDGIVNVQRITDGVLNPLSVMGIETYVTKELQPVNGDDILHENFAAGELPAGQYRLSIVINGGIREQQITIEAGKLTFVRFLLNR